MKKTIQTVALAMIALASNGLAEDINLRLDIVSDVNNSTGGAFTGYGWFGNLGSATPSSYVGGPWTVADIASNFRAAHSFNVDASLLNNGGSMFTVSVGSAPAPDALEPEQWPVINPNAAGQFAGQNLLVLMSNRSSFSDVSAGTEWIVFQAAANFATANSIYSKDSFVELSTAGGAGLTFGNTPGFWIGGVSADGVITTSQAVTSSTVAVPEPSSLSLLILGASGLIALRRFRKNS
jgi:hypothetical protein